DQRDCHHGSPRIQLAELVVAGEAGLYVGRPPTRLAMAGARTVHAAIRDIDGDPRFGACPDQRFVIALLASSRDHQPFGGDVAGPAAPRPVRRQRTPRQSLLSGASPPVHGALTRPRSAWSAAGRAATSPGALPLPARGAGTQAAVAGPHGPAGGNARRRGPKPTS